MDKSLTYYLAGPMSGIPQFNIPAFEKAACVLRAAGFKIVSPAELDSIAIRKEAVASPDGIVHGTIGGETWGQILSRDVRVIADKVQGIIFLPGWTASKGARLEAFVGLLTNKVFAVYANEDLYYSLDNVFVRDNLKWNMP